MHHKVLTMFCSNSKITIQGQNIHRNWFVCTESKPQKYRDYLILGIDSGGSPLLYCVYCVAFSTKNHILCKTGLQIVTGKPISQNIKRHDSAEYHRLAIEKYKQSLTCDNVIARSCNLIENRYVVNKIIQAVISVSTSGNCLEKSEDFVYWILHSKFMDVFL